MFFMVQIKLDIKKKRHPELDSGTKKMKMKEEKKKSKSEMEKEKQI